MNNAMHPCLVMGYGHETCRISECRLGDLNYEVANSPRCGKL